MIKYLFYFSNINSIGGVETFFYNLARLHGDKDITVVYKNADVDQVKRLAKYVRVRRWNGKPIECEIAFFNYSADIFEFVKAKEYFQMIHADYSTMKLSPDDRINNYIAVSKTVADKFEEYTGKEATVIYNPVFVDKPKKVLRLVSATRTTWEKGAKRMNRLAKILEAKNIPFTWEVFTNDQGEINNPNIIIRPPCLNVIDYINDADYLVQLSETEAFCFSVAEALKVGTPVIITPCPVFKEIGCNDSNSIVLPFNFGEDDIDTEALLERRRFKYDPPKDEWGQLLKAKASYKPNKKVKVIALNNYYDLELHKECIVGDVIETTEERASYLEAIGLCGFV